MKKTFSIIIATYRADELDRTLNAVCGLDYPSDMYECIVCDNGDDDGVRAIAEGYSEKYSNIRYIEAKEKQSPYYARNKGFDVSTGDILCFLDDDCTVSENWMNELNMLFNNEKIMLVKTKIESGYSNIWNNTMDGKNAFYFERKHKEKAQNITFGAATSAIRRSVFTEVGPFKEIKRGADSLLSREFMRKGYEYAYLETPAIRHFNKMGFNKFLKRSFAAGYSSVAAGRHGVYFKEMSIAGNIKFIFVDAVRYIGGYKCLFPLCVYGIFKMLGRLTAKAGIFKDNPIK